MTDDDRALPAVAQILAQDSETAANVSTQAPPPQTRLSSGSSQVSKGDRDSGTKVGLAESVKEVAYQQMPLSTAMAHCSIAPGLPMALVEELVNLSGPFAFWLRMRKFLGILWIPAGNIRRVRIVRTLRTEGKTG